MSEMVRHGIHTSRADIWIHFFPREGKAFWYWRHHMITYLKESKLSGSIAFSKDGTATGNGIPVSKKLGFIQCCQVPAQMVDSFKWEGVTDREAGTQGEHVMDWFLSHGGLRFGGWKVRRMASKAEQMSFGDFELSFLPQPRVEVKTELVDSPNIYVQTHERGHNPLVYKDSKGQARRRYSGLPSFEEGK
jgi:hypothetical protein